MGDEQLGLLRGISDVNGPRFVRYNSGHSPGVTFYHTVPSWDDHHIPVQMMSLCGFYGQVLGGVNFSKNGSEWIETHEYLVCWACIDIYLERSA